MNSFIYDDLDDVPLLPEQPKTEGAKKRRDFIIGAAGKLFQNVQVQLPGGGGFEAIIEPRANAPKDVRVTGPELDISGFPKLKWSDPKGSMLLAWIYFRKVWDKQKSEAFVYWHWDAMEQCYYMVVPAFYTASAGALNYKTADHFCKKCSVALHADADTCPHCGDEGDVQQLFIVGTSHSHGSMSHFHSGTDHDNELNATGAHLTFGYINKDPMIEFSFVVSDGHQRFATEWYDHCESPLDEPEMQDKMMLWLGLVSTISSLHNGVNWVVVDSKNRPVFVGTKTECEEHVEGLGQVHKDALRIGQPKKEKATAVVTGYTPGGYSSKGASIGAIGRQTVSYRNNNKSKGQIIGSSGNKIVGAVPCKSIDELADRSLEKFTEDLIDHLPTSLATAAHMAASVATTIYDGFGYLDDYLLVAGPDTFGVVPSSIQYTLDDDSDAGPALWIRGKKFNFADMIRELYDRLVEARKSNDFSIDDLEQYVHDATALLLKKCYAMKVFVYSTDNERESFEKAIIRDFAAKLVDSAQSDILEEVLTAGTGRGIEDDEEVEAQVGGFDPDQDIWAGFQNEEET